MQSAHVLVEQRKHPRAHLRLPARVRWRGPLGMGFEIAETIDASREGLLLACREDLLEKKSRVWVLFPFDATATETMEPETAARVVRVERDADGGYRVGLQLQARHGDIPRPSQLERRGSPRLHMCLPILMRAEGMPWPEETMTRDFSRRGLRFETSQVYEAGEIVRAKIAWGEWAERGEISGRVVRVEPAECAATAQGEGDGASAVSSCVAVQWIDAAPETSRKPNG